MSWLGNRRSIASLVMTGDVIITRPLAQGLKLICFLLLFSGASSFAAETTSKLLVLTDKQGLAVMGYDVIAYFTDRTPVRGDKKHSSDHEGATYLFASAEHKSIFDANPTKYEPAYGGYCGYAASIDRLSPVSPLFWQIIDGRLVLQHNEKAFRLFNEDAAANLAKADDLWPGLVARNGVSDGKVLIETDKKGVAIQGYDPVSYHQTAGPKMGNPEIEATFNGALYHFASQENRAAFENEPLKYSPAYGGYCGYAASIGKVRPADPLLWSVVDGSVVLQHTKEAAKLWDKDVPNNKVKADKYWPHLVKAKVGDKTPVDSLFSKSVLDLSKID